MNRYPRETIEFIGVTVTVDGVSVTTGVGLSVTKFGIRPTIWIAPVTIDGRIGVMTETQDPGTYQVWARVTDSPETPVILCGQYVIT